MKAKTIISLLLIFSSCISNTDNQEEIISKMRAEVTYLSSDKLEGRETGTEGERLAAEFIASKFTEYNLIPKGTEDYYQYFDATIKENPHSNTVKREIRGINVVGILIIRQSKVLL